jgi:hypothetical protein
MLSFMKWFVLVLFCLLWLAEDETMHIEESIQEKEFDMEQAIVSQEALSETSWAVVYQDGMVSINDAEIGIVALTPQEAFALLDVLYRHMHILRGQEDTVPQTRGPRYEERMVCEWCGCSLSKDNAHEGTMQICRRCAAQEDARVLAEQRAKTVPEPALWLLQEEEVQAMAERREQESPEWVREEEA